MCRQTHKHVDYCNPARVNDYLQCMLTQFLYTLGPYCDILHLMNECQHQLIPDTQQLPHYQQHGEESSHPIDNNNNNSIKLLL